MKLYKTDTKLWTVREVEGNPYPGMDSDGEPCYVNTHFKTELEAWDEIVRQAEAYIKLASYTINQLLADVEKAHEQAADAARVLDTVQKNREKAGRGKKG